MAFPSIRSQVTDSATANETTHTVSLPATISAGDTILVIIRCTVAGAFGWPDSNWNVLFDSSPDASDDQMAAAWKEAVGNEGGTTISVTSGNGKFTSIAIAVQDAANPRKTPPFLGTVGTGSATEPDAGNCNPNADAKDYLWWTFFGMEGEQTGITTYPGNFTLNQSGLVTTGTGGAVTTNCTMASAARQLNASSLDAGVWDVTGTLDDWTAYTIAFHPSEPVGSQVFPPTFPAKYVGTTALTIAVNLLQTTLAPVQDPFFQNDWPNPAPVKQQPINFIRFYNPTELEAGEKPFKQDDWPNPAPTRPQLLVNISSRNTNENTQGKSEFALPPVKKPNPISYVYDLLSSTLKPQEQGPFTPVEYPTPLRLRSGEGYIFVRQIEENPDPFSLKNQPNPLIGQRNPVAFTFSQQLSAPEEIPFTPIDYPNPSIARKINEGWMQNRPQYYEDETIKFATAWDNPRIKTRTAETWSNNNLQDTLKPPVVDAPFSSPILNVPDRKGSLIVNISSSVHIEPTERPENSQTDWPNPPRKRTQGLTWLQERDQFYQDIKPHKQDNWPNPAPAKKTAITFIHSRKIDEPDFQTPFVIQFANPLSKSIYRQFMLQEVPFILRETKPIGSNSTILPPSSLRRENTGFVLPRPFYYPISIEDPFRQISWPNPAGVKAGLIVNISSRYPEPAQTQKPFNQNDWPNPVLRVKRGQSWIDYFIYDSNEPPIAQSTTLPLVKKFFDASFTKSSLITSTGDPTKTFDYPNPIIIRQQTLSHIDNLLQRTLDPGVGETPFNQSDYPNPTLANKIHESGWVWDKRFYYTEEPLIPAQYNWPIFRPVRRNDVSFVIYRIGSSDPRFITIADVPIRFGTQTLTWLDNPILVLNTPAVTEIPFRQIDWPLFRSVRSARDIFTIIGQNPQILPQIVGRVICLLADDTEYFVEVTEKNHEYDVRVTEYGIEVGGKECQ